MKKITSSITLAVAMICNSAIAETAHTYRMLMPATAGSPTANTVEKYSACFKANGHSVIPEFAPGADGLVAVKKFKEIADPAGTTTVFLGNFGINMMGRWSDVDLVNDFDFVGYMNSSPLVLTYKTGKWENLDAVRSASKVRPLNVGYNTLSLKYFAEVFAAELGINIQTVPYKGSPQMIVDGLNGTLDLVINSYIGSRPHIQSGDFTVLTSTLSNELAKQVGHKNIWQYSTKAPNVPLGLIASVKPGTPAHEKNTLVNLINKCSEDPDVKQFLDQSLANPVKISGEEIKSLVKRYVNHQF